jgi:hypothetical protein
MEAYCAAITSEIGKAKFRASNTELRNDFSAILNTRVTHLDQLDPRHAQSHPQKPKTRKRHARQRQLRDESADGILGFASFLGEAEAFLTGPSLKERHETLKPNTAQPTPLDIEGSAMQSQTCKVHPTATAIKQTSIILVSAKPACLHEYIESQCFSVCRRTKSHASQAGKSATGDLGLRAISHFIIEQICSEPELAKKQKVEETELGLVL